MNYTIIAKYIIYFIAFLVLELLYFKIADKYNIVDKPNHRSSHTNSILRGGGIIFPIAGIIFFIPDLSYVYILCSLVLLAVISFWDDVVSLSSYLRFFVHILAVILLLVQTSLPISFLVYFLIGVGVIGIINSYNFMDGINGITALYSLVCFGSLLFTNIYLFHFFNNDLLIFIILSLLVFSYFNVRQIAKCFSGDVGSITIALILSYLIILLTFYSGFHLWIFFLGVYGIDTFFTLVCRILRKEVIMQAHRSHFYQFLVNELKCSHFKVSFLYALIQLIVNIVIIHGYYYKVYSYSFLLLFGILLLYIIFRFKFEGKSRLFIKY